MGLEVVVNEIIEQGRSKAQAIEKEGLQEAKEILSDAKARAEKTLAERQAAAERDAGRIRVQETARAEFEAKKEVLYAKRALLVRLKEEALEGLRTASADQRKAWLSKLVKKAEAQIPEGIVHVRSEDKDLVAGLTDLKVEGDLDAAGGLVVDSADGTMSIDYRFESLLEDAWPEVLRQESPKLFG